MFPAKQRLYASLASKSLVFIRFVSPTLSDLILLFRNIESRFLFFLCNTAILSHVLWFCLQANSLFMVSFDCVAQKSLSGLNGLSVSNFSSKTLRSSLYVALSNCGLVSKPAGTFISKLKVSPFAPNNRTNGLSSIKKKASNSTCTLEPPCKFWLQKSYLFV